MMKTLPIYLLILIVLLAIIGVVAGAGITIQRQHDASARAALTNTFGPDVAALCTNPPKTKGTLSDKINKYLVIDAKNQWVYQPYQSALASGQGATSKDDLTTVVCLAPNHALIEQCSYHSSDGTSSHTINRYQNNIKVTVIDVTSNKLISSSILDGPDPDECPDQTDTFTDISGAPPSTQAFIDWLNKLDTRRQGT